MNATIVCFLSITRRLYPASELPTNTKTQPFTLFFFCSSHCRTHLCVMSQGGTDTVKCPTIFSQVSDNTHSQIFVLCLWGCLASALFFLHPPNLQNLYNKASILNVLFVSRFVSFWEGKKNIWECEQNGNFNITRAFFFGGHYRFSREKEQKVPGAPGWRLLSLCSRHQRACVGL